MTARPLIALERQLCSMAAEILGLDVSKLDADLPLQDQGMNSLQFVVLITRVENELGGRWTEADIRDLASISIRTAALLVQASGVAPASAG